MHPSQRQFIVRTNPTNSMTKHDILFQAKDYIKSLHPVLLQHPGHRTITPTIMCLHVSHAQALPTARRTENLLTAGDRLSMTESRTGTPATVAEA